MQWDGDGGGRPVTGERRTLLCFSHLRWAFVFQRPQHLLTRAAAAMRVVYWEEPVWVEHGTPGLQSRLSSEGVLIVQPHLPWGADSDAAQRRLLDAMLREEGIADPILWYYTPQALAFSDHVKAALTVYDCMDELSAFAGADPSLPAREQALLRRADLVFTGGQSLYEAKRRSHHSVHAFPSGVDAAHFRPARGGLAGGERAPAARTATSAPSPMPPCPATSRTGRPR